ncbi:unnamed protein product [Effrenium voratum]|nr:unnamed protein product [Effrenium voratum]
MFWGCTCYISPEPKPSSSRPMLIWIVRYFGEGFYLYLWGAVQCLILAFMWIYPNLIQPLFNEFRQLQDADLKAKIEALAAEVNFPLTKLFEIDGSKRSGHSNAYFFGFWKYKRIVLYDTLPGTWIYGP